LLADLLDRLLAEGAHGPVAGQPRDLADEIADQFGAVGRMHHLGVEHQAVIFALLVLDDRERGVRRDAGDLEARRHSGDAIAVTHPDLVVLADLPGFLEQAARALHLDVGAAELAVMAALDFAAELLCHRLLAVADAEHRHAGLIDRRRRERRVLVEHGCGAAGQDHAFRPQRLQSGLGFLERNDLAIDVFLAHAAGDELGDLRAEIDDQDRVVHEVHSLSTTWQRRWRRQSKSSPVAILTNQQSAVGP